jgi:hypothetical protein
VNIICGQTLNEASDAFAIEPSHAATNCEKLTDDFRIAAQLAYTYPR